MNWRKPKDTMRWLWLTSVLSLSAGCAAATPEQRYINVRPQLAPLSAEISDAMQPDSTDLWKRAEAWLQTSGALLDSVTNSSANSVGSSSPTAP